jgi:hypothetical protein
MTRVVLVALITSCLIGTAMAQSCESKAVSAEGKPLHGAAKASFIRKCKQDACEGKAVSAEGKPLHGAAKNSFMAKCKKAAYQTRTLDNVRVTFDWLLIADSSRTLRQ